ncbi:MAG TPA: phosphomannomutase, partial [Dehalococcoidia bacterium]|nr:phosphomannomutase [Dehalococcoidia bacterium]
MTIKFGTDGWRALMPEDFTIENVKLCAQAVCNFMKDRDIWGNGLIIGYDTRLNSNIFAESVAEVAAGNQIPVILCDRPCPTPVLSYNLVSRECGAGVVITASHNSREWNGFKFKLSYGGSASEAIISEIEKYIFEVEKSQNISTMPIETAEKIGMLEKLDPEPAYLNHIAELVDLNRIRNAGLNIAIDS